MGEKKNEVVDNTELVPVEVTEEFLKEKLYEVRGVKVMLDADLAEIYGLLRDIELIFAVAFCDHKIFTSSSVT